ncbi:hypothetical protein AVEN_2902-1 [Araneus ventricosus]|uniref:RNase H type-1 domain-containing protein n=1 Tax=Araneus ventricosus TaxID=182803 RepID=A0A4Y2KEF3_ARAVE|nr:hypothetical protein AVEN_2902-1 [Araneus ventricosus]
MWWIFSKNLVSNLKPHDPEAETLPLGHHGLDYKQRKIMCHLRKTLQDINREAQGILGFVSSWAITFKLEFNASKSKVIILDRRERNTFTSALTLNGIIPVCFVKELQYLDVILDSKYCWKQHILYQSNKCEKILWGLNRVARNTFGLKSNVKTLIYKQGIVPFICYGSQIWGTALKKKINCRILWKIQRKILFRVISGYRTIFYEAVFAISGFPPIDIFIVYNKDFKIVTKTCIANNQDVCLPVSKMPHPSEQSLINLVSYYKNIEDNFPVVCFADGSKINSNVGLAFVVFQDHIETEVHQFRIRDECSVLQAELLRMAQAVTWIHSYENFSSYFLICSDSLSSLYALNCIILHLLFCSRSFRNSWQ